MILQIAHYIDKRNEKLSREIKKVENKSKTLNTRKLNIVSDRKYDKNINDYYASLVNTMSSSVYPASKDFHSMNKMEETFIKEFLYQVQFVRKKYSIRLTRYADGHLMVHYNGSPVGRISLKNESNIWMQVLIGLYHDKDFSNITFEQALQNIKYWISYIKNHLKEQRI